MFQLSVMFAVKFQITNTEFEKSIKLSLAYETLTQFFFKKYFEPSDFDVVGTYRCMKCKDRIVIKHSFKNSLAQYEVKIYTGKLL